MRDDAASRLEALRRGINELADQLCAAVDGHFDFAVGTGLEDETLEKLSMLTNFVLDTARRGMAALHDHNTRLAELDRAKTAFVSNVSHELRTPLTLMLGPIEDSLARDGSLRGDDLQIAYRNTLRLLKMVNALLDFSRIEAGRMRGRFVATDVATLTADLASGFRSAIERAGLALSIECQPLEEPSYVDREMWEKIVLNLVSNALKFTPTGEIRISLQCRNDRIELEVSDTGVGIPAEHVPRIFDRFHRVEGTRSRTHEGTGIGLALVRDLVTLHGGSVRVTSTLGAGSTFVVSIPTGCAHLPPEQVSHEADATSRPRVATAFLQEANSWAEVGLPAPAEGGTTSSIAHRKRFGCRVLVVDDNADMRAYVARLLADEFAVECVAEGSAALESVRKDPPDLILSDVMMPHLNGFELVRALRADPRTALIPIVLLSARADEEARLEGLDAGADDYLVKPFAGRELIARVRTHVELSNLRMESAVVQRVGSLLNEKLELQAVVQVLTDEVTRATGAKFGAFFHNVVDASGEWYMLYTLAGAPREAFAKFPNPRATKLFAPTFEGEDLVRIDDVTEDPRYGHNPPYHGLPPGHLPVRSYLAAPVIGRSGEVLGGLFLGHPEPGVFGERSERLLRAIAVQAAIALENAQLYERARAARAEAEAASRAKDEFLAMLGHELRNPLAPILTVLELMAIRGDPSTQRERTILERQVKHMVRLVDDLLDVSRITRGKIELRRAPVEIAEVVAKGIELSSLALEQGRQGLEVDVPKRGLPVDADAARLAQVVSNLLTNAAKYSPPEGQIRIRAHNQAGEVVLRVADDGNGIDPALLGTMFEPFTQGHQSLARSHGGLGVGLAIVRSIVTLHGGTVEAHSEGLGRGSEFVVRLRLAVPSEREAEAEAEAESSPVLPLARDDGRKTILIVDDNADAVELLAAALESLGYDARVAHDGAAALHAAKEVRPDVALLDIGLPLIDGYELARRFRATPSLASVRLVALTGYGQDADRHRSAAAGFDEHLVKPVEISSLAALLDRLLAP